MDPYLPSGALSSIIELLQSQQADLRRTAWMHYRSRVASIDSVAAAVRSNIEHNY